ncbi:YjjG family noncanonical pyrimidine nucleotidase [Poritiphilus flavus]|uniref:Noncanonical pyrimidine nucleotidase, YjjG family n=1 Tax=Poritiphilus flavus TaxID=2697053 RepID=A0A6L9EHD8_9FLAO|nr:YjjG family noncanonical pyrimidine nucleotidase [Poritiphilus flavus]NAS14184.1 noncanonical pyrimidine nucleotidase, YjjG family [Poritiphilus flavus]
MFKGVVTDIFFDLDHTLWDFDKNSALTFEQILQAQNIVVNLPDFLEVYVRLNQEYWKLYREERITKSELRYGRLKRSFDALGYPISDNTIDLLAQEYIAHLSSYNNLFPNTIEILEYLKPNYRLHIVTNGFQEIQEKKLRNADILDYFDQVVNSEMAGVKKPNPKIFNLALEKAGVSALNSLMIGDNLEADILGAQAVGFHTLHFNPQDEPLHEYCEIIQDLSEIKNYL